MAANALGAEPAVDEQHVEDLLAIRSVPAVHPHPRPATTTTNNDADDDGGGGGGGDDDDETTSATTTLTTTAKRATQMLPRPARKKHFRSAWAPRLRRQDATTGWVRLREAQAGGRTSVITHRALISSMKCGKRRRFTAASESTEYLEEGAAASDSVRNEFGTLPTGGPTIIQRGKPSSSGA